MGERLPASQRWPSPASLYVCFCAVYVFWVWGGMQAPFVHVPACTGLVPSHTCAGAHRYIRST